MKKKILVIDNTFDPPHGSPEICAQLEAAAKQFGPFEIQAVRAPESKIPLDISGWDAFVLSGSKTRIAETHPWIELEMQFLKKLYAEKIPTLGICYGEQLMARTFLGDDYAAQAVTSEFGWAEIIQNKNYQSPILKGLPEVFYSYQAHSDEVKSLKNPFRLAASSKDCPVQAFDIEGIPMFGIQFHPERGLEKGDQELDKKIAKDKNFRALNRENSKKVFSPKVASTIFSNFLKIVWGAN